MSARKLLLFTLSITASAHLSAADREIPVICRHGDLHSMPLVEAPAGSADAHPSRSLHIGPTRDVWIQLPAGASVAPEQRRPVPVRDLDTSSVEVLASGADAVARRVNVPVFRAERENLTPLTLIQVQIDTYGYTLPEGCRMLAGDERSDYALALLNNAGCLLPESAHRAIEAIPGAPDDLRRQCGWESDMRLALHLMAKSADRGSLDAGWLLSQFYLGNVAPELANLRAAYLQLAHTGGLGHASARLMSGIMRWRGNGVSEANAEAAFPLLLPYARSGIREAQGIIGTMYLTGEGVPQNRVQAHAWCSLAAEGSPLLYTDPIACRDAAEQDLSYEETLKARDLAVEIHNGSY